jgi:hypothetical protein
MRKLVLKPGVAGKASIKLKAKGENLAVPALPLVVPVSHQVRASNGNCWGADYSLPAINSVSSFKSRSD